MTDAVRKIHIFVDISNITCGAIEITNSSRTKLNVPGLVETVRMQREVARKVSTCTAKPALGYSDRANRDVCHQFLCCDQTYSHLFKVAVGSVPPNFSPKLLECEERPWKKENFQITFLQRVQSTASSRFSEQRLVVSFRLSKMMI